MCGQNGIRTVLKFDTSRKWPSVYSILIFFKIVAVLLCHLFVGFCRGMPLIQPRLGNMSSSSISLAVDYLSKYGYLPHSDLETSNLRTEERLEDAIRVMQKFGNVPQTGVVDEATLNLMKRKRCGVPDLLGNADRVRRYTLQGQRWSGTNLTWSVKEPVEKTDLSMVRRQLASAFNVWAEASVLTFTEIRGTKADILVSFLHGSHGDGYPFDGEGSVLAHAFFPGEGIGGDAHFDAEERWVPQQPFQDEDGVNFFAVAAHEIGHSLGLSHSSTPGSLMFPYYQMVGGYLKLPEDDATGIQQLYGSKTAKWATMPNEYSSPPSTTRPTVKTTTKRISTKKSTTTKKRIKNTSQYAKTSLTVPITITSSVSAERITETPFSTTAVLNDDVPNPCNTSVDAISVIRREVFLFKDKYFWRLDLNNTLKRGYPALINRFWHDLPGDIEKVDAVYERPYDTNIVFFIGKQYWLFIANQLVEGYPQPLTKLGLPSYINKIDAVTVWGHNGKTYLFSGDQYWKLEESYGTVELDYPRNISTWKGIPTNLDAAFQGPDGNTYFFKDKQYWKFNDLKMKVRKTGNAAGKWFGCRQENSQELYTSQRTEQPSILQNAQFNGRETTAQLNVAIFFMLLLCHIIWKT